MTNFLKKALLRRSGQNGPSPLDGLTQTLQRNLFGQKPADCTAGRRATDPASPKSPPGNPPAGGPAGSGPPPNSANLFSSLPLAFPASLFGAGNEPVAQPHAKTSATPSFAAANPAGLAAHLPGTDWLANQRRPGKTSPGKPSPANGRRADVAATLQARSFTNAAGTRPYKLFVPTTLKTHPALLVMLHGCTQDAVDFALGTRMNDFAARDGFLVLYPEQVHAANAQRCWNWFNPTDQRRDTGEPSLIAGITHDVMREFAVNPAHVYAAGLSAGGAKAAVLGMAYPDLFRAIGVHSGLACGAAHDLPSALRAMRQGSAGAGRLTVPLILFQGDRDTTVNEANAAHLAAQANPSPPVRVEEGAAPGGLTYRRITTARTASQPALEDWRIHGLGHAWSGGSTDGSFTDPKGPDASAAMLRFFRDQS